MVASSDMIYQLAEYIRTNVPFPAAFDQVPFDPELQVIVGGYQAGDGNDILSMKELSGPPGGYPNDRQDVPVQFISRGDTPARAREILFAVYDADALSSELPDGRRFRERFKFSLGTGTITVAKFSWIQSPFDLGAVDGGFSYSANAIVTWGNMA